MVKKAIFAGLLLVAVGIGTWALSSSNSPTALIPAAIGVVIALLGLGSQLKPDLSHHFMHAVAVIALIGLLGSAMSLLSRFNADDGLLAEASQSISVVVLGALIFAAVQSFKSARLARTIASAA